MRTVTKRIDFSNEKLTHSRTIVRKYVNFKKIIIKKIVYRLDPFNGSTGSPSKRYPNVLTTGGRGGRL